MVTWDSAAWLEYKKTCLGRSGAHQARLRIWENNLDIYREGGYSTRSGKDGRLDIRETLDGTLVYDAPFAAQSVCFLSSKGLIHEADKGAGGDLYELMNRKDILSNFSDEPVCFTRKMPEHDTASTGAYSDGISLFDLVAGVEDDISQMYGIL